MQQIYKDNNESLTMQDIGLDDLDTDLDGDLDELLDVEWFSNARWQELAQVGANRSYHLNC